MNGESRKRERRDSWNFRRQKQQQRSAEEELESKLGFDLFSEGDKKLGWLLTFAPVRKSGRIVRHFAEFSDFRGLRKLFVS